ncbi:B9 domain [Carpediemonas membranifera]|uniref:B9 domain-containing protein 2 n=1 Tax=Carpediemonas membranifera TaxID=201153 RepID=A0A8J6DX85_9EUKA|nr:B9 domain [Carpediemonas membranifera]|eukprot:KAG9389589.1 B9 domain [Carpediemonas membranifera]
MAELFLIGQLKGGIGFSQPELSCKYSLVLGEAWKVVDGETEANTQVDEGLPGEMCTWSCPIDVHLTTESVNDWPKLVFEVWSRDRFGRNDLAGYGVCNIPYNVGNHQLKVHCWKPVGNALERLTELFVGGSVVLKRPEIILNSDDREDLVTRPTGVIELELNVLANGFEAVDGIER